MAMKKDRPQDADPPDEPSQAERIRQLKDRLTELTGGSMPAPDGSAMDPDLEEEFLKNVVAVEEAGWTRPADHLAAGGLELTPPDRLDDQALSARLRDVIHAMALRNMYVMSTDHLSDRELYCELLEHLHEETMMGPATPTPGFNFVIDLVSSGSDEDTYLYLKYYADEDYRRNWHQDYPQDEMPEKTKPPYDRDRFLPQPDWTPPDPDGEDDPLM
jgi:hypothetical protein